MLSGGKKMIYSEESFAPVLKYWNNTCRSIVHTKEMIGLIFLGSLSSRHQQIPHSAVGGIIICHMNHLWNQASANSTQCSRDSRGSRARGAPDYLVALGVHIDIESLEL